MAVPKKKRSPSRNGMRWAHKQVTFDQLSSCGQCGEFKRPHHLCSHCGYYNGKQIIIPKSQKRAKKIDE